MAYPRLFSPILVGGVVLRNRIIMPAMHMGYSRDGVVNDRWKSFYWERAKGGVGAVMVGACDVVKHGGAGKSLRLDEDRFIPGMKELSSGIKAHGATAMVQLYHMGRSNKPEWIGGEQPVSCSAVASPWSKVMPRALDLEEVHGVIDAFAAASVRAQEAGFDVRRGT
jgi:2,4-dienoyl-CoA reductase (NADPH2)